MFCSFTAQPRILHLFCKGRVIEVDEEGEFEARVKRMGGKVVVGARAGIVLDVFKASQRSDVEEVDHFEFCLLSLPHWRSSILWLRCILPTSPSLVDRHPLSLRSNSPIADDKLSAYYADLDGFPGEDREDEMWDSES